MTICDTKNNFVKTKRFGLVNQRAEGDKDYFVKVKPQIWK